MTLKMLHCLNLKSSLRNWPAQSSPDTAVGGQHRPVEFFHNTWYADVTTENSQEWEDTLHSASSRAGSSDYTSNGEKVLGCDKQTRMQIAKGFMSGQIQAVPGGKRKSDPEYLRLT